MKRSATPDPDVSVVIPVFNDAERLETCLAALAVQRTNPDASFEVVVVDNGSSDDVSRVCDEHPFVALTFEPRPGSYQARNTGIDHARGSILLFTDSDCVPNPDWIRAGIDVFAAYPACDIAVGEISLFEEHSEAADASPDAGISAYERATAFRQRYYAERLGFGPTANLAVRRAVFDLVGRFDAARKSGGDKEFGIRARNAGIRLRYAPTLLVRHPVRVTRSHLEHKTRRIVGGDHVAARGRPLRLLKDLVRYALLRPVKASLLVWGDTALNAGEKRQASSVILSVAGWQLHERARLLAGAEPKR